MRCQSTSKFRAQEKICRDQHGSAGRGDQWWRGKQRGALDRMDFIRDDGIVRCRDPTATPRDIKSKYTS